MGTSLPEGSERLLCTGDPIGPTDPDPDDIAASNNFHPNVVVYGGTNDGNGNMRTGDALGIPSPWTTDFSIEAWVCRNYPDSITNWGSAAASAQGYGLTGFFGGGLADATWAGFWFRGANFEMVFAEYDWSNQVGVSGALPFGWNHLAGTFDRDGNMVFYINGVSQGSTSISTSSAVTFEWSDPCVLYMPVASATANSMKEEAPFRVAAMAMHTGLLTVAQIQDSVNNISLQDLTTTTGRLFFSDTILYPEGIEDGTWGGLDSEHGTWYWTDPYDAPDLVDVSGGSGGTAATTTVVADSLAELPNTIKLGQPQDEDYLTTAVSIKGGGAVTHGSMAAATNTATPWIQSLFSESSAVEEVGVVFGDDPTWPPNSGVTDKGYA